MNTEILVLDFGSQYTQLIARRLREYGVYTEIVPYFESIDSIKSKNPKGIILSGGPASVYEEGAYKPDSRVFDLGIPVLGICYGMQYIAHHFGGKVIRAEAQEFGKAHLELMGSGNYEFVTCDDKVALYGQWASSFVDRHAFMDKELVNKIFSSVEKTMQESQTILMAKQKEEIVAFIMTKDNYFECYSIDKSIDTKEVVKKLIHQACKKGYLVGKNITTRWDIQDKAGIKVFDELGFVRGNQNGFMVELSLEYSEDFILDSDKDKAGNITNSMLFDGVKQDSIVWMSHADKVEEIPEGFIELAKSGNTHYCAIADLKRKIYAMQFHPEVVHSECGGEMLKNFAVSICKADTSWNMHNFAESEINKLRAVAKDGKVLCAVSGGVDSSVVATLLYRAIGENLIPVFVDTGLLRAGEREAVEAMFRENLGVPLITVDASEIFLGKLKGVTDPEKKRKIIGETFIEVFEMEAKKHNSNGEIKFLAQGTLYPDVIESVSVKGPSKTIKSHHNVGGLPDWMKFELIEPLRELFKDEVRALGRELGMPEMMLMRHPFPGPGLAIRIMGEVNKTDLDLLRACDSIFIDELHKHDLYNKVWQAFCVLLNVKSVGVMGDNRTYDNTICVRAVEALDGMTATFSHLPHSFLEGVANRIINEVEGINRVVYDITSKPPGTIEWE